MTWKAIPSFPRYDICTDGRVRNRTTNRMMSIVKVKGYHKVGLCRGGGERQKLVSIHRIIWETFRGEIPSGLCINHIDGDKTNNRLSNLEVVTAQENTAHATRTGLVLSGDKHPARLRPETRPRGEKQYCARLTEADVRAIRASDQTLASMGRQYGVSSETIGAVVRRKTWKHI